MAATGVLSHQHKQRPSGLEPQRLWSAQPCRSSTRWLRRCHEGRPCQHISGRTSRTLTYLLCSMCACLDHTPYTAIPSHSQRSAQDSGVDPPGGWVRAWQVRARPAPSAGSCVRGSPKGCCWARPDRSADSPAQRAVQDQLPTLCMPCVPFFPECMPLSCHDRY